MYPVNSGSEANDLAVMMARAYTGNFDIISLRNGYHGMSPTTMGLTGLSTWKQLAPNASGIHQVCSNSQERIESFKLLKVITRLFQAMNPDVYKGLWGGANCRDSPVQVNDRTCSCATGNECEAAENYVKQLDEVLMYTVPQKKVAGFFLESIQVRELHRKYIV